MVYYRYLFMHMKELSPNEGLVYSALLSHSLMVAEHFEVDGSFNVEYAKAFVRDNVETMGIECIGYRPVSTRRLAKVLNMSENTVRRIKDDLENIHHLTGPEFIICPLELLESGYIDISPDTGLKGLQLTFYGLLKDRSSRYHGVIDTWASRLAGITGLSKKNVYNLLHELHSKKLVERTDDGRLKIK